MAAVDPSKIAARVAVNVHRPSDDVAVLDAVNAAIIMVATETGRADAALDVPDDPLTSTGLVGLATALFVDELAVSSSTIAVADPSFDPVGRHRDPYLDRRTFFDRLNVGAPGVA